MKLSPSCYDCLKRLIIQAASMATNDVVERECVIQEGIDILDTYFSRDQVSIVVATRLHDAIKLRTGNSDPYRDMKDIEIAVARTLSHELENTYNHSFSGLLKFAAMGNAIDFFCPIESVKQEIRQDVSFAIDMSAEFEKRLKSARGILYLADNTGEAFFDLPLLQWMRQFARVTYVVKSAPVQNDITLDELHRAGLLTEFGDVITTGTASPGIDFIQASGEFRHRFDTADIIFAKGMGYYESLSELPSDGRILYCLKAKCQPVSDSLNVPLHSYVTLVP